MTAFKAAWWWAAIVCASLGLRVSPAAAVASPMPATTPPALAQSLERLGDAMDANAVARLYAPLAQVEPYPGVRVSRDVRYADAPRNLLDVFVPDRHARAPRPVIVFVHGGAFILGDRRRTPDSPFFDNVMLWAASQGFVGVNVGYRLAPAHPWPAAQQDLRAALGWVKRHIAEHGGDPRRVILVGHSAGATHAALYLAHRQFHVDADPRRERAAGPGVAGAILISGLYDIAHAPGGPPLSHYFGTDYTLWARRSALPGLADVRVPILFVEAERDPAFFRAQSRSARTALCEARRCPSVLVLRGHNHFSEIFSINTDERTLSHAMQRFARRAAPAPGRGRLASI